MVAGRRRSGAARLADAPACGRCRTARVRFASAGARRHWPFLHCADPFIGGIGQPVDGRAVASVLVVCGQPGARCDQPMSSLYKRQRVDAPIAVNASKGSAFACEVNTVHLRTPARA